MERSIKYILYHVKDCLQKAVWWSKGKDQKKIIDLMNKVEYLIQEDK